MFFKNKRIFIIFLLFFISLGIRLFFNYRFSTPWVSDEPSLFHFSKNVFKGQYYGTDGAYWPPAFIFFAGFLFKIFGLPSIPHIFVIQIVQSILGAMSAVLCYLIAEKMFKKTLASIISGLTFALLPSAILYTGMFFTETLWVFFILLGICLIFVCAERKTWVLCVLTGIIWGLAALTRPTSLPLPFLACISLFLYWKKEKIKFKSIMLFLILIITATFLSILPWTIRNYIVTGEPVMIDVNAGINLYIAHNEKSNGTWIDIGKDNLISKLGDSPEADKEGRKLAIEYIKDNPVETINQAINVHLKFWTDENSDVKKFAPDWLVLLQKIYSFKFLAIASIIGFIFSIRNWRNTTWIAIYILAYNALIDFMYIAPRYRFAVEPLLTIYMGFGIYASICFIMKNLPKILNKVSKNRTITRCY